MTYYEAKKYLEENKDKVPENVSLFIATKDNPSGETNLKPKIGEEVNNLALEEFGFLDNDYLEVFATFHTDGKIYYPTLYYYFQTTLK